MNNSPNALARYIWPQDAETVAAGIQEASRNSIRTGEWLVKPSVTITYPSIPTQEYTMRILATLQRKFCTDAGEKAK